MSTKSLHDIQSLWTAVFIDSSSVKLAFQSLMIIVYLVSTLMIVRAKKTKVPNSSTVQLEMTEGVAIALSLFTICNFLALNFYAPPPWTITNTSTEHWFKTVFIVSNSLVIFYFTYIIYRQVSEKRRKVSEGILKKRHH